ncbi:AMP-binding protein [Achromobacter xylosoxidans]
MDDGQTMIDRSGFTLRFTQGLQRAAQVYPDRVATICNYRTRTWRELEGRVARLAAALKANGAQHGVRIAMLGLNSDRYLEYYLPFPGQAEWSTPSTFAGARPRLSTRSRIRARRSCSSTTASPATWMR